MARWMRVEVTGHRVDQLAARSRTPPERHGPRSLREPADEMIRRLLHIGEFLEQTETRSRWRGRASRAGCRQPRSSPLPVPLPPRGPENPIDSRSAHRLAQLIGHDHVELDQLDGDLGLESLGVHQHDVLGGRAVVECRHDADESCRTVHRDHHPRAMWRACRGVDPVPFVPVVVDAVELASFSGTFRLVATSTGPTLLAGLSARRCGPRSWWWPR